MTDEHSAPSPPVVLYRLELTGKTPHEIVERLVTKQCPACGASWHPRGATPRQEGGRSFRCETCGEHFKATEVDEHNRPVTRSRAPARAAGRERENGPGRHP